MIVYSYCGQSLTNLESGVCILKRSVVNTMYANNVMIEKCHWTWSIFQFTTISKDKGVTDVHPSCISIAHGE